MTDGTLGHKIAGIHERIKDHIGNVGRVGIALYNQETDQLSTFVHSTDGLTPLEHYRAHLAEVQSLKELHEHRQSRIIDDLAALSGSPSEHTRRILAAGYKSSYTSPLYAGDQLLGFLFFDSQEAAYFRQNVTMQLDTYAQLIAALISCDLSSARALHGVIATAHEFSRHRDNETSKHVQRVAWFARCVASELAQSHGLTDEDVEFIFQFAGLHDIGKIAVPDSILLKPGKLTAEEYLIAQGHVAKGLEMVEVMVREFGLSSEYHIKMLRSVVAAHHERIDGQGYPAGLRGDDIPLVGRILAVADVFDALTNPRPYKSAWSLNDALQYLRDHAGKQFDSDCVRALVTRFDEVCEIHARLHENEGEVLSTPQPSNSFSSSSTPMPAPPAL
ncbi:MAG: HD-GYP domain-containing protein [Sterolibacterium sp.]|nr:HD-GYP domain-containing protein [Sterolibacterium sp.]